MLLLVVLVLRRRRPRRVRPRADQRFADSATAEVPNFQRHVLPLMGRLGCNGRACHGSFQGQGGFRLSLFGYDFKTDHEALLAKSSDGTELRVDPKNPRANLILCKSRRSNEEDEHGGGKRMDVDSWQYRLLLRWVEADALPSTVDPDHDPQFVRLEVTPTEIVLSKVGETAQFKESRRPLVGRFGRGRHAPVPIPDQRRRGGQGQ